MVGDFDGDGKKEIVAQEGLTDATYTLRIFGSDGAPRSWNVPTLTGIPFAMVAADLDHNGKLETILVSYLGTQATLHVFQPDGSERTGWPLLLPNPNQYSQAFLAVGDLNRDGHEEIVFSHEQDMYLINADGTPFSPSWPLHTATMGFGAVVIGDIDADGQAEIVTTRNDVVSGTYYDQKLLAIRSDGSTARSWQLTGMNGYNLYAYPLPTIGDFNQDGITDIGVAYMVTGPGGILPGIATVLSTGKAFDPAANDWPMLLHDTRNTGVLRRAMASIVTLLSSENPSVLSQPVTFSVSVISAQPSGPVPTGTVNLLKGSTSLATCTLSSGQCTLPISIGTPGTHLISANYVGDANFSVASAVLSQVVNAPDFALSASSAETVNAGSSANYTISVAPSPSPYNFAVTNFTCSGLPTGAACTFAPSSVTPGESAASVNLSISTTARSTARLNSTGAPVASFALWLGFGAISIIGCFTVNSRKRIHAQLLSLALLGCALWTTSCGGSSSQPPPPPPPTPGTPAGTYTVLVTATGKLNISRTTNVSLKVN